LLEAVWFAKIAQYMQFAVVKFSGKQYFLTPNAKFTLEGEVGKENENFVLSDVLMVGEGENVQIGQPLVEGLKVTAKVLTVGKGDKVLVTKFKAKSRFRRKVGFRPLQSVLQVVSIGDSRVTEEKAPVKKAVTSKAKKTAKN